MANQPKLGIWRPCIWGLRTLSVLVLVTCSHAQDQTDLTQLSPEQLSRIEVTSASKKEQKLGDTAAAVYVITQQDIRDSAATNIPELLQMVPGLDVARISGSRWAISSRGFNGFFQDSLLVLIDGRSVFDPLFAGVMWDEQDIPLENIERIEIIRGPGAVLWGSNASNGIINIITKRAQDTQGTLVSSQMGDQTRSAGTAQIGDKLGKGTSYRVYSKYYDDGPAGTLDGELAHDSSRFLSGGFRLDSNLSSQSTLMLEGQGFNGASGVDTIGVSYLPPFAPEYVDHVSQQGENIMVRLVHQSLDSSVTTLQTSFSHVNHPETGLDVTGNVAIMTLQHEHPLGDHQSLVAGVEYDFKKAMTSSPGNIVWWQPGDPTTKIASAFVQDEILFFHGDVRLTAGLGVENSNVSGFDAHPNLRALWKITHMHTVWAAFSNASMIPGPDDTDLHVNLAAFPGASGTQVLRLVGNPNLDPEYLRGFEVGYRFQPDKKLSLDLATFLNRYTKMIEPEIGQPFFEDGPPSRLVLPMINENDVRGNTMGGELAAKWSPMPMVHFALAYSFIEMKMSQAVNTFGDPAAELADLTPRHKLTVNSSTNLTHNISFSQQVSFVDRRVAQDLPGYTTADTALAWKPSRPWELKTGVLNLFDKKHIEFIDSQAGESSMIGRSVYGKATWRF